MLTRRQIKRDIFSRIGSLVNKTIIDKHGRIPKKDFVLVLRILERTYPSEKKFLGSLLAAALKTFLRQMRERYVSSSENDNKIVSPVTSGNSALATPMGEGVVGKDQQTPSGAEKSVVPENQEQNCGSSTSASVSSERSADNNGKKTLFVPSERKVEKKPVVFVSAKSSVVEEVSSERFSNIKPWDIPFQHDKAGLGSRSKPVVSENRKEYQDTMQFSEKIVKMAGKVISEDFKKSIQHMIGGFVVRMEQMHAQNVILQFNDLYEKFLVRGGKFRSFENMLQGVSLAGIDFTEFPLIWGYCPQIIPGLEICEHCNRLKFTVPAVVNQLMQTCAPVYGVRVVKAEDSRMESHYENWSAGLQRFCYKLGNRSDFHNVCELKNNPPAWSRSDQSTTWDFSGGKMSRIEMVYGEKDAKILKDLSNGVVLKKVTVEEVKILQSVSGTKTRFERDIDGSLVCSKERPNYFQHTYEQSMITIPQGDGILVTKYGETSASNGLFQDNPDVDNPLWDKTTITYGKQNLLKTGESENLKPGSLPTQSFIYGSDDVQVYKSNNSPGYYDRPAGDHPGDSFQYATFGQPGGKGDCTVNII